MIALVARAEDYLRRAARWDLPSPTVAERATSPDHESWRGELAALRQASPAAPAFPCVLAATTTTRSLAFARRPDVGDRLAAGPRHARPRHPHQALAACSAATSSGYAAAYRRYFEEHAPAAREPKTMLDPGAARGARPGPRRLRGGPDARRTPQIVADIYAHTMDVIERAEALGG